MRRLTKKDWELINSALAHFQAEDPEAVFPELLDIEDEEDAEAAEALWHQRVWDVREKVAERL